MKKPNLARRTESRPPTIGGFTLLETLVALSVLGLIMGAVYGSYRAVTSSIADVQPRIDLDQKGRFFIQRLSRQVRCCYGGRQDQRSQSVPDQNDVKKVASEDQTRFFQGGRTLSNDVTLQFVTTSNTLNRRSNVGYLAVVSYKMDRLRHTLLTREEIYGRRSLNDDDGDWRVILEDVLEAKLQYFDGTDWREEWDSNTAAGLPRALRIKLVLASKQGGVSASVEAVAAIQCFAPAEPKGQVRKAASADKERAG